MQKSLVKSKINNLNKPEIKQAWYSTYGDNYEEGLRFLLKSIDSNSFISENLLEDIKNKKPIQYILGEWDFYTGTYKISPAVLIPRPETEVLVDYIKNNIADIKSILDLGTGSGCIAIELAKIFKDAHVLGVDISTKALEIAHKNNWQSNYKVKFMESNWFESVKNKFDLIVANPPYVPEKKGGFVSYSKIGFVEEKHKALFKLCNNMKCKWVLSNSNTETVREALKKFNIEEIDARRAINSTNPAAKTKEVIVYN